MKNVLLAGAFALASTSAFAGGYNDPKVEPTIDYGLIEDAAVESANDDQWVGVLMTFLTLIVIGVGS